MLSVRKITNVFEESAFSKNAKSMMTVFQRRSAKKEVCVEAPCL